MPADVYLAIDPGASGAIAAVDSAGICLGTIRLSETPHDVWAWVVGQAHMAKREGARVRGVLERVASRPGQGVASMFKFGTSYGMCRAWFVADLFAGSQADINYRVVGIVSESVGRVGRHIHGVAVLGTTENMGEVVKTLNRQDDKPQRLVITRDDMDGSQVRALFDRAGELGMTLARLPKLTDFKTGVADGVEVQPLALEDLLGRPQVPLDRTAMRSLIEGRRVLVTGAGGSIGSELVRQISAFGPSFLTLLENSEHNLYTIDGETALAHPNMGRQAIIADVRDRLRMGRVMAEVRPDLVFHAAALKHVPIVEANILEGISTNTVGTVNVADACRKAGVAVMVLISTDKAVNPTSVMGATKRLAERYCQSLDIGRDDGTRFVTVRFGNVLGSAGSVVPLFQQQLAAGGPLTVTHPEISRYFMTVHESVELVLQASAIGSRGTEQEGKIFVLDMGEPVLILDLARQIIRLAGLQPEKDIGIEFIGLRPGEKLYEEMFHSGESLLATECPGLLLASPMAADAEDLARDIDAMAAACAEGDGGAVMAAIRRLVPEYRGAGEPAPERATG